MAGGLLQIAAYGYQDVYLTDNPQITLFKTTYRRHSNFSMQTFEKTFNDAPNFGKRGQVKVYRLGDLCTNMYIRVVLNQIIPTDNFAYVRRLGHAMIDYVEVEIGGIVIDKHIGIWLDVWYELTRQGKHERGYAVMIGDVDVLTAYNTNVKPEYTLYIPLKFWFNRHVGLALPLIALQYHEVHIKLQFEQKEKLVITGPNFTNIADMLILDTGLLTNYIYLDKDERQSFAYVGHEYLIEQVQYNVQDDIINTPQRFNLQFNHPTKEIIWVFKSSAYNTHTKFLCYTNTDNWQKEILKCSKDLLINSMIILLGPIIRTNADGDQIIITPGAIPTTKGNWEEFIPNTANQYSSNRKLVVTNESQTYSLWINTDSMKIGSYSLTKKIGANILFQQNDTDNYITISNLTTTITERDISIPISQWTDTRIDSSDIAVNMFSNYGTYITGNQNPVLYAQLEFNSQVRSEKRNGKFYGELQPYMHHSNTPKDGINLYSFAIEPETLQPTGSANLSLTENQILTLWIGDNPTATPQITTIKNNSYCVMFALGYNIFRIVSGLSALAYTD